MFGLPLQWAQYPQALPLVNPASAGTEAWLEANIGNQRSLGLWRNNQNYYANANFRLYRQSQQPLKYHVLGVMFTAEKEGRYLQRNRGYLLYGYHLKLHKDWKLSGAASLGMANYVVAANDFNGGGSAIAPDGNVGIWLRSQQYNVGIGHHQIFQGKLTPIWETTILKRYWSFTGSGIWTLGPWVDLKAGALCRLVPQPELDLNANLIFQKILSAGATYRHQRGLALAVGLERIKIRQSIIKGVFSYQIPLFRYTTPNIRGIELTLKYLLHAENESDENIEK